MALLSFSALMTDNLTLASARIHVNASRFSDVNWGGRDAHYPALSCFAAIYLRSVDDGGNRPLIGD